jgi:hypothetical protein
MYPEVGAEVAWAAGRLTGQGRLPGAPGDRAATVAGVLTRVYEQAWAGLGALLGGTAVTYRDGSRAAARPSASRRSRSPGTASARCRA